MGEVARTRHLDVLIAESLARDIETRVPKLTWPRRVSRGLALLLNENGKLRQLQRGVVAEALLDSTLRYMEQIADIIEDGNPAAAKALRASARQGRELREPAVYERIGRGEVDEAS